MKKVVLLFTVLIAGFQQLKAQQLSKPLPDMNLSDGLYGNLFKPQTDNLLSPNFKFTQPDSAKHFSAQFDPNVIVVYSKMPVARLTTDAPDRMPVYNPATAGVHYDMLIKKVVVNPAPVTEKTDP